MRSKALIEVINELASGTSVDMNRMNGAIADGLRQGDIILSTKHPTPEIEEYLARVKITLIMMLQIQLPEPRRTVQ